MEFIEFSKNFLVIIVDAYNIFVTMFICLDFDSKHSSRENQMMINTL